MSVIKICYSNQDRHMSRRCYEAAVSVVTATRWRLNPRVSKRGWDDGNAWHKPCHCPLLSCRTPKWTQSKVANARCMQIWICKVVSSRGQSARSWKWSLTYDNKQEDEEQRKEWSHFCPSKNVYNSDDTITWRARPETRRTFLSHSRLVWNLHLRWHKQCLEMTRLGKGRRRVLFIQGDLYVTINARWDPRHPPWPESFSPPQYDITSHPLRWVSARMCKNVFLALRQGKAEVVLLWL